MALSALTMMQFGINEPLTKDGARVTEIPLTAYDLVGLQLPTATIPFTMAGVMELTLTAGTVTVDLRDFPGLNNEHQDGNGLRVIGLLCRNPAGNNLLTISAGTYDIDTMKVRGNADDDQVIMSRQKYGVVGASNKTIVITGTGSESFKLEVLLG